MTDHIEMNKWNEAALLDRIVVWDRWIEKGIAPEGTKEARDAAMQIIIQRVERLRDALDGVMNSHGEQLHDAFAVANAILKETGHG